MKNDRYFHCETREVKICQNSDAVRIEKTIRRKSLAHLELDEKLLKSEGYKLFRIVPIQDSGEVYYEAMFYTHPDIHKSEFEKEPVIVLSSRDSFTLKEKCEPYISKGYKLISSQYYSNCQVYFKIFMLESFSSMGEESNG